MKIYNFIALILLLSQMMTANGNTRNLQDFHQLNFALIESIDASQKLTSGGQFVAVGGDPNGCDFDTIQAGINFANANGIPEVRVAKNLTYTENISINDISITIIGGYDDCFDMSLPVSIGGPGDNKAIIDGAGINLPVISINGSSQRNTVILKNLNLVNGTGGTFVGGGISAFAADVRVELDKVDIRDNFAEIGGGLSVFGGDTDFVLTDSVILANEAEEAGGGVYCNGSDNSVLIGKDSGVILNDATSAIGKGGGIYVSSGCTLALYSAEINSNTATTDGGGIYAFNGARVVIIGYEVCVDVACFGDNVRQVRFNGNAAGRSGSGEGGAIYATGPGTFVTTSQVWIDDNTASNGGALSVRNGADVLLLGPDASCAKQFGKTCNLFDANGASNFGGAIYNNGGFVRASQFYFERNRADLGTAIYAVNDTAYTGVTGSVFARNGIGGGNNNLGELDDVYVIRTLDSIIELTHTTFAENDAVDAVFGVADTFTSHLNVINSIIHDSSSGVVLDAQAGSTFFSCVIAHESASFAGNQVVVVDPEFSNIEIGDFHINAEISPAVDFCTDSSGIGFTDVDGEAGGFDDPSRPNQGGNPNARFDAGADETYANDVIFADGFEPLFDP